MFVLVTGATGFIGSHVVDELLRRGETVRALVRNPARAVELRERGVAVQVGDIGHDKVLAEAVNGVDAVIHCAAATGENCSPAELRAVNVDAVRGLLEAVRRAGKARVALITGLSVLGIRHMDPADEDMPCRPSQELDSQLKAEVEQIALDYNRNHGLGITILRPAFVYGPRDTRNLPKLVDAVRQGKFVYIGSKQNVVPLVHVADMATALVLAVQAPATAGRIYHIADGSRTTMGELIEYLAGLLGCAAPHKRLPFLLPAMGCGLFELLAKVGLKFPPPISRDGLRFLGTSRYVDIRRARDDFGFQPQVTYRQGVADTLRWIQSQSQEGATVAPASA